MDINKFLSNRRNQYIIGGVILLGVGYYLYKKGKLTKLTNAIGMGAKKYPMGYLQQGKIDGVEMAEATAVHFANPRPKESEVAPNGISLDASKDYVIISGTGDFDGKFKVRKKWTDKNGNLGAIWIGVKKKLGGKDEKITKYIGKGQIQVVSE